MCVSRKFEEGSTSHHLYGYKRYILDALISSTPFIRFSAAGNVNGCQSVCFSATGGIAKITFFVFTSTVRCVSVVSPSSVLVATNSSL